jgi:hypothetical protein
VSENFGVECGRDKTGWDVPAQWPDHYDFSRIAWPEK